MARKAAGVSGQLFELDMRVMNRPMDVLHHWEKQGWLLLDPPYQRGDVWGRRRRVNLIRSLLLGIPIPALIINDRLEAGWPDGSVQYAVVDGKQRCRTFLMFLSDQLAIPGEWVGLSGEAVFSDLPIVLQRRIQNRGVNVCESRLPTLEKEAEVYELINYGGVPQGERDDD